MNVGGLWQNWSIFVVCDVYERCPHSAPLNDTRHRHWAHGARVFLRYLHHEKNFWINRGRRVLMIHHRKPKEMYFQRMRTNSNASQVVGINWNIWTQLFSWKGFCTIFCILFVPAGVYAVAQLVFRIFIKQQKIRTQVLSEKYKQLNFKNSILWADCKHVT